MKAEDLMIGGWVFTRGQIEQVTSIYDGYICTEHYEDSHDYYFEPMPLTPEILEKNGFKSNDNMFGFQDYELSKDFLLENRGERYCLVKRFPGHRHSTFFIIEVRFIHELQHCLKLCGIDKTIEL